MQAKHDWICPSCGKKNRYFWARCPNCNAVRP